MKPAEKFQIRFSKDPKNNKKYSFITLIVVGFIWGTFSLLVGGSYFSVGLPTINHRAFETLTHFTIYLPATLASIPMYFISGKEGIGFLSYLIGPFILAMLFVYLIYKYCLHILSSYLFSNKSRLSVFLKITIMLIIVTGAIFLTNYYDSKQKKSLYFNDKALLSSLDFPQESEKGGGRSDSPCFIHCVFDAFEFYLGDDENPAPLDQINTKLIDAGWRSDDSENKVTEAKNAKSLLIVTYTHPAYMDSFSIIKFYKSNDITQLTKISPDVEWILNGVKDDLKNDLEYIYGYIISAR